MAKKRKHAEFKGDATSHKQRYSLDQPYGGDASPGAAQSRIDPTYGQRGAFPGLNDDLQGDVLFYGPASDGLEYLRMVRSEAKTVPNLLVAPSSLTKQPEGESLYEDYPQGYYADGAYTALPHPAAGPNDVQLHNEQGDFDPQEAYYASLCARFEELSSILQNPPPSDPSSPPLWCNAAQWRYKILKITPKMSKLAQLPQDMVLRGLEILETVLTTSNLRSSNGKNVGAWAWGLLGRCRAVGQMSSEDVGVLRQLGKQAVYMLRRISAGKMLGREEDVAEEVGKEEEEEEDEDEDEEEEEEEESEVDREDGDKEGKRGDGDGSGSGSGSVHADDGVNGVESVDSETPDNDVALEEARQRLLASLDSSAERHGRSMPANTSNGTQGHDGQSRVTLQQEHNSHDSTRASHGHVVKTNISTEALPYLLPSANAEGEANAEVASVDFQSVHATLDMLVTIIGEFYGQKDLLDGRLLWDEIDN